MGEENNGTTMIIAKLDSKELEQSIDELVDKVANRSQFMANKFEMAMDTMKSSIKDFAITQKVSVDLMNKAWREMSSSFDAMVKAQEATKEREGKGESEILTVAWLKDLIRTEEQRREGMHLGTDELSNQNLLIEKQRAWLKEELLSEEEKLNLQRKQTEQLDKQKQKEIRKQQEPIKEDLAFAKKLNDYDLPHAKAKLVELESIQRRMNQSGLFKRSEIQAVERDIERLKVKISNLTPKSPMSLTDVLGMRTNTLDNIARKMQAIQTYRGNLDINTQRDEISRLNLEYSKLGKLQNEILGKNTKRITENNNALARSFGYIRNRLVYALTLGAATSFVKQIYEIRGQYELLERSLGVLVNSFQRGSEIFQELNAMAIKSPFTLMDLAGAAKQLTAYNFSANEVVNTTRRLADISAALGVPMERLTYNLGQIRAQTVLTARDARDFANAGLPIVKSLSAYYTELEGKVVSTGDVYNRMSKKMVSYTDVMAVLNKMTDEGGKFFDFQAKQADTLRVQLANLTLAWNNMLNEIGETNQGLLTAPLKGLRTLFRNWETLNRIIWDLIIAFGALKAAQIVAVARLGALGRQLGWNIILGKNLTKVLIQLGNAMKAAFFNKATWAAAVVMAMIDLGLSIYNNIQNVKELNKEIKKTAEESAESIDKFLTNKGNKITFDLANKGELGTAEAEKAWESIREELEASSSASRVFMSELLSIEDVNERVVKGFTIAQEIRDAENALKELGDSAIYFSQSVWGGIFGEGLVDDLKDYYKSMQLYSDFLTGYEGQYSGIVSEKLTKELEINMKEFQGEIDDTAQSIKKFLDEQNITSPNAIAEIMERVKSAIKAKNPEIQGELASLFDIELDQRMSELTNGAVDSNTSLWKTFMERLKTTSSAAFSNISDDFLSQSGKLSKEQQEAVDKNLKYFEERMPLYYEAIKAMVDDASKLRIQIGVTFNAQPLTDFQKEVNKRIKESSLNKSALDFGSAALLPTANDDLSSWVKTRQDAIKDLEEDNKKYEKDDTDWSKDKISFNNKLIQQNKNLLDLFHQQYVADKKNGNKKDYLGDSLTKEIQLIGEIQKRYKEYIKMGVDSKNALKLASDEYNNSLEKQNAILKTFGFKTLSSSQLATMPLQEIRDFYQEQLQMANAAGNTKGIEALEKAIANLNVEITKVDYKKITDGLNNELSKLKEEYSLSVELDANPELSGVFADMLGIDDDEISTLPKTFNQVISKMQERIDKIFMDNNINKKFDLSSMLDSSAFEKWVKDEGQMMDDSFVKALNSIREFANKIRVDEAKATTKNWSDLVEKYGDLQSKIIKTYKESVQEQLSIAQRFGSEEDKKLATDIVSKIKKSNNTQEITQLQSELSKIINKITSNNGVAKAVANAIFRQQEANLASDTWDDFKESELYSMTFEDMANNSTHAIQLIIEKLESLKNKVKEDPASMKALMQSLKQAEAELEKRNPFLAISSALKEIESSSVEIKTSQSELAAAIREVEEAEKDLENASELNPEERAKAEQKVVLAKKKQANAETKVVNAENKHQKSIKKLQNGLEGLSSVLGNIQDLFTTVAKFFEEIGDSDTAETINSISKGFSIMITVIMGVVAAMILLESTSPYLLAIAAALGVIVGLVSFLAGKSNKNITKQVEESERAVKQLEYAYIDLQQAMEKAYGTAAIGAKQAALANKNLQLAEIQRQIQLEKSRKAKNRDEDKILDLQKQYKELYYEIQNGYVEIVDDLMGTDVASFAENLVSSMIDAFKQGEDYMKVFSDKFDEMVDNMIMKSIVSRVVSQYIEQIWSNIDNRINQRSKEEADEYAKAQNKSLRLRGMSNTEIATEILDARSLTKYLLSDDKEYRNKIDKQIEEYKKAAYSEEIAAKARLDAATEFTNSDIDYVMAQIADVTPELGQKLKEIFGEYYKFGETSEAQLSSLQQGISGITEEQAGVLEAYWNANTQQQYVHTDLLTQIRDAVVMYNNDVNIATSSQILLQLQQSFQVQMAIQTILMNWSSTNGMSVRVEMI